MQETPQANRIHIAIYGKRNSGKSSLINAITSQPLSVVSSTPGTTTDPVLKSMEVHGLGPVVWIDTAGIDDQGALGEMRVEQTKKTTQHADMAIVVCTDEDITVEQNWMEMLDAKSVPTLVVLNKSDVLTDTDAMCARLTQKTGKPVVAVSALKGDGMEQILDGLRMLKPTTDEPTSIVGHLAQAGDVVLLVMPQDIQAPKGRLILPQVQTTRDLLDKHCIVVSCTTDELPATLKALQAPPKLIITDSQVFGKVYALKPEQSVLTSFSVLFAQYKGDVRTFIEGAAAIDALTSQSKVLIAEACTHAPLQEDIGREKIPAMLRKRYGADMQITVVAGRDFPNDLTPYDLVIHCGACMFNRKMVLQRIAQAKEQGVPITNYGITIAHLTGILDKVVY